MPARPAEEPNMDEKDKAALTASLAALPQDKLDEFEAQARRTLESLEDANSAFPATQEFLRARGLTHMRELDAQGRKELREHLERTLQELCKAKA
jgi:hypothetical protein